jgi:hypothetical protein
MDFKGRRQEPRFGIQGHAILPLELFFDPFYRIGELNRLWHFDIGNVDSAIQLQRKKASETLFMYNLVDICMLN